MLSQRKEHERRNGCGESSLHYKTSCRVRHHLNHQSSIFFLGLHVPQSPCTFYTSHLTSSWNSLACVLMHSFRKIKARAIWCGQWENVSYRRKRRFPSKEKKTNKSHQHYQHHWWCGWLRMEKKHVTGDTILRDTKKKWGMTPRFLVSGLDG